MALAALKHPIKTLAVAGLTTAAIGALPLIGVSSATGAAVMALGFAGASVAKTTKDVVEAVKDGKEGRNDELREDLEDIGGDSADLAMSLPFVPKALKQVKRAFKFGPALKLNTQGFKNIKNADSLNAKMTEYNKVKANVEYETIANEMGLDVKPELTFKKFNLKRMGGAYDPATGELALSESFVNPNLKYERGKYSLESAMRHELEHFNQVADVATVKGVDALKNATSTKYQKILDQTGGQLKNASEYLDDAAALNGENLKYSCENLKPLMENADLEIDNAKLCNEKMDINFKNGYAENSETLKIQKKINANDLKISQNDAKIAANDAKIAANDAKIRANESKIYDLVGNYDLDNPSGLYGKSIAQENKIIQEGVDPSVIRNIAYGDKSSFNSSFYDEVVKSRSNKVYSAEDLARIEDYYANLSGGLTKEQIALYDKLVKEEGLTEYVSKKQTGERKSLSDALKDTINDSLGLNEKKQKLDEIKSKVSYWNDSMEQDAYAAQEAFEKSVLKGRPNLTKANIQAQALTSDSETLDNLEQRAKEKLSNNFDSAFDSNAAWFANPTLKLIHTIKKAVKKEEQ